MEEITLKDILDVLVDIKVEVNGLKQEVVEVKQEVNGLKQEVNGLKQEVAEAKQEQQIMKQEMKRMDEKIDRNFEETKAMLLQLQKDVTEENIWNVTKLAEHEKRIIVLEEKAGIRNGKIIPYKGKDK